MAKKNKYQQIGSVIYKDGIPYFTQVYTDGAFLFKDEDAFVNRPDGPCYVPDDYVGKGLRRTVINGKEFISGAGERIWLTADDILAACHGNTEFAQYVFGGLSGENLGTFISRLEPDDCIRTFWSFAECCADVIDSNTGKKVALLTGIPDDDDLDWDSTVMASHAEDGIYPVRIVDLRRCAV